MNGSELQLMDPEEWCRWTGNDNSWT